MTHTSIRGMNTGRSVLHAEYEVQIIGCRCGAQTVRNPHYNADQGRAQPPASGDWRMTDGGRWLCPACAKHGTHKDDRRSMAADNQAGDGAGQVAQAAGRDDRGDIHGAGIGVVPGLHGADGSGESRDL